MEQELLRRLDDLWARCERANILTHTAFLTPAEQALAAAHCRRFSGCRWELFGGDDDCERKVLFFLPDWQPALVPEDALDAIALQASFGAPGHRDYLGALLALGVRRDFIGDLRVDGSSAWLYCLNTVTGQLLELQQAGHVSVRAKQIPLSEVPAPIYRCKALSFTVQSPRLDAALGGLFSISRSLAAKKIAEGAVCLNGLPCLKPDAPVDEGDILTLRGAGKGKIVSLGGSSRKGRLYIHAERYL